MTRRKYIRIALSEEDEQALQSAKAEFEASSGLSMSDSMFVLSILRKAVCKPRQSG